MKKKSFIQGLAGIETILAVAVSGVTVVGTIVGVVAYGEGIKSDVRSVTERMGGIETSYTAAVGDLGKKMDAYHDEQVEQRVDIGTIKGFLRSASPNLGGSPAVVDMIEKKVRDNISTTSE